MKPKTVLAWAQVPQRRMNHSLSSSYSFSESCETGTCDHCSPQEITNIVDKINGNMSNLEEWAASSNLSLNGSKTKQMLITTQQMSSAHGLKDEVPTIKVKGEVLERKASFKLLGTWLDEHLKWTDHIKHLSSSCYAVLSTLRKLKNLAPFIVRKQLVESLVMSKLDYNVAAGFVLNRYTTESDVLEKLRWLPIKQRIEYHVLRLAHKSLWESSFPDYLRLERRTVNRQLRSSQSINLTVPLETGTFQDCSAKLFNQLSSQIKNERDFISFLKQVKQLLLNNARERLCI